MSVLIGMQLRGRRGWLRATRKRLRRVFWTRPWSWLALTLLPPLYVLWMRLVWATSRVEIEGLAPAVATYAREGAGVVLYWHEENIVAPWVCAALGPSLGLEVHALVARSDAGDLAARVAERCGVSVFRGGTSHRRSRRHSIVFRDMIEQMRSSKGALFAIAVDGSRGPAYRMKRGPLVVARSRGAPVFLLRTWFTRCLRLPTWDRIALPLPWSRIPIAVRGPYYPPSPEDGREALEVFRSSLEAALIELAIESYRRTGQPCPPALATDA